jgi:RNA polymerase sigma-70 factor (ECF subfamily)
MGTPTASHWAEAIYALAYRKLVTRAKRLLNDGDEAQDAVQTVFFRLLSLEARPPDFGEPYLLGAIRRECLQRIRNRVRHALTPALLPAWSRAHPSPEARIAAAHELDRVLRLLTPRERQVCLLQAAGYNYDELAQLLGISTKTVDALIQDARRILRRERGREREREGTEMRGRPRPIAA